MAFLRKIFGVVTSTKIGLIVMIVIAGLSLIGGVIPQNAPRDFYLQQYGPGFGKLLLTLELDHVFRTNYYSILLIAFSLMVFACALKRLPVAIRLARRPEPLTEIEQLRKQPFKASLILDVDPEEARLHIVDVLKRRFYKVATKAVDSRTYVQASKNAFSRYGSFILHLSFVLLLIGGLAIARFGRERIHEVRVGNSFDFVAARGETINVDVEDFRVETDNEGRLRDYICEVEAAGKDLGRAWYRIRPNHPLGYGGVDIYLESYEEDAENPSGFLVSVYDSSGELIVPHVFVPRDDYVRVDEIDATLKADVGVVPTIREISDAGVTTHFIYQSAEEASSDSLPIRFVLIHAIPSVIVSLKEVRQPGQVFIIAGFTLLTFGTIVSLYLSHRKIWFIVEPTSEGRSQVHFGGRSNRHTRAFEAEFERVKATLDELS